MLVALSLAQLKLDILHNKPMANVTAGDGAYSP